MTRGNIFSESFWDGDIIGTTGWDAICKRMKDGKKVCVEVAHYLRDRAKAESDYCKSLQNLARKADGREEIGVLGDSWRQLKAQTERIASVHDEAASTFIALQDEITKFNDEQTKIRKQTEDNMKRTIQCKKNEYQKTMSLKKSYEDKCKDYNNAEENLKTLRSSVTTKTNDLSKAEAKLQKSTETRENADVAYQNAIESLETVRNHWEQEHIGACNTLEDMEKKRIEELRDLLWRVTNVDSIACVKHDECSETVRMVLEKCDIDEDLQEFVKNNRVEKEPPERVLYENYYSGKQPVRPRPPIFAPPPRNNTTAADDGGLYASVDVTAQSPSIETLRL